MGDEEYKSVLIVNDSADAHVTFYQYAQWDVICWLSFVSKILKPCEKYLHRSKEKFRFKMVARFQDNQRPDKTILELQQWDGDKLFKVTGGSGTATPTVTEEALIDWVEKRICLRKIQRDKELKRTHRGRNFYEILGLDMKEVREMSKEQQAKAIKKGFYTQMRIWHPDRNGGDEEITKEILFAYETLQNEEKRAHYNNLTDYDEGWLSLRRYKAIFKPECVTEEQKKAYKKRMFLFAISALLTVGGIPFTACTAGVGAPALVICGGGFVGAGLQSLLHTLKAESVVDGCSDKGWCKKVCIGFAGGAVTAGAAVGITAAVTGIGSAALESAAFTTGQYLGSGAATGAVGGMVSSLAADAGKRFVDGEDVTLKQAGVRALVGAAVGSVAGVAGGAVTKAVVGPEAPAAAANLKGEIGEQVAIITGTKRLGNALARKIPRMLTENGTEAVVGCPLQIVKERLDDSVENRSPREHIVNELKNAAGNLALGAAREGVAACVKHAFSEVQVDQRPKKEFENPLVDDEAKPSGSKPFPRRSRVRFVLDEKNGEGLHNWRAGKCSATYKPLNTEDTPDLIPENLVSFSEGLANNSSVSTRLKLIRSNSLELIRFDSLDTDEQPEDGKVKYISNGAWFSKMVVTFFENSEKVTEEVKGSGKSIHIPSSARKIEVRFQVSRPFWGDVCKYDRFQKSWFTPYEPHIFRYDTPPIRTFTISGGLWWEAVMRVSDEYHEETKEM